MKKMKLNELLETVRRLVDRISRARMDVRVCEECGGKGINQEQHEEKHLKEAIEIRDELPNGLVWNPENLRIQPIIKLTIDGEGHITANLDEIEIS